MRCASEYPPSQDLGVGWRGSCGERVAGPPERPPHPRDSRLWMIAELLSYPFGAPPAAERAHRCHDGVPDLLGTGFLAALQRRHEQSIGAGGGDAEMAHRCRHRGPPSLDAAETSRAAAQFRAAQNLRDLTDVARRL